MPRPLRALLLAVLLAVAAASAGPPAEYDYDVGEPETDDVVVLSEANFDARVAAQQWALVEFYAPWCGHCKSLEPEYRAAATELKGSHPDVMIAKVDATQHTALAARFGVRGYPTLKWFVDGKPHDFDGGRTSADIVGWVVSKAVNPLELLSSEAEADTFREGAGAYFLVGFFEDVKGDEAAAFRKAAQNLSDTFAVTDSAAVAAHLGLAAAAPAVAIVKIYDEPLVPFSGSLTDADALVTFVRTYSRPLVMPFTADNSAVIFQSAFHILALLPTAHSAADTEALLAVLHDVALEVRGSSTQLVTVECGDAGAKHVLDFFGVSPELAAPLVVGFAAGQAAKKYRLPADAALDAATLTAFARGVADGTAERERRSAPPPESNDGPVVIVTGDTFDALVLAEDKDVLLEIYAPWCSHCKQLAPTYEKLGMRFADIPSVVIAKMDGTANEHPAATVPNFPTILFYPARPGAEAVAYTGDRTLKAMTKFIKQHAVLPYELPLKNPPAQDAAKPAELPAAAHDEL